MIVSSSFSNYELFIGLYYQRAYLVIDEIFSSLSHEKLNSINNILLPEKGKFLNNIIRTRKKRRTIRMGSNVSKRSFGHDYRTKKL